MSMIETTAAVFGKDLLTNPTFGVAYVLLWVGIVPASLLLGPFYRAVSPLRRPSRSSTSTAGRAARTSSRPRSMPPSRRART